MREAGFKTRCAGTTASRGGVRVSSVNAPVPVGGMAVLPGDLIHAIADPDHSIGEERFLSRA